jgi:hypothetical protein
MWGRGVQMPKLRLDVAKVGAYGSKAPVIMFIVQFDHRHKYPKMYLVCVCTCYPPTQVIHIHTHVCCDNNIWHLCILTKHAQHTTYIRTLNSIHTKNMYTHILQSQDQGCNVAATRNSVWQQIEANRG